MTVEDKVDTQIIINSETFQDNKDNTTKDSLKDITKKIPYLPNDYQAPNFNASKVSSVQCLQQSEVAQKVLLEKTADYSKHPEIIDLCNFIKKSPTAWHAVQNMKQEYLSQGFTELNLTDKHWDVEMGGKYFVTKNESTFMAFVLPTGDLESFSIVGAHTDSPALRVKPNAERSTSGVDQILPEFYGGPTLPTWFDRDLGLAGRVSFLDKDGKEKWTLFDSEEAVAFLSTAPIHLNREQLKKLEINEQKHLPVITTLSGTNNASFIETVLSRKIDFQEIIGKELFLYPIQEPRTINGQFLSSWRLDNLLGTHAGYRGLLKNSEPEETRGKIFISWDNEEVGSSTAQGAASDLIEEVTERVAEALQISSSEFLACKNRSGLISVDSSHAEHPNYKELYEPQNTGLLGGGVVIKVNAQQNYATDSISEGWIVAAAKKLGVPVGKFCARTDGRCGSTIGSIVATKLGIRGVDIGVAQLAMHSAREHCTLVDHLWMIALLESIYSHEFVVEKV